MARFFDALSGEWVAADFKIGLASRRRREVAEWEGAMERAKRAIAKVDASRKVMPSDLGTSEDEPGEDWTPFDVNPWQKGVYEVLSDFGSVHYAYWNGEFWGLTSTTIEEAKRAWASNERSWQIYNNCYTGWRKAN